MLNYFERNQHKLFRPYFVCLIFHKKKATFKIKFILFSSIFSSIKIIHPWTCGKLLFHVNKDSFLCVKKIILIFCWHGQNILNKIWSYSCIHVCLLMFMLTGSWTNIPSFIRMIKIPWIRMLSSMPCYALPCKSLFYIPWYNNL